MKRNSRISIKATPIEKDYLKKKALPSNEITEIRSKLFDRGASPNANEFGTELEVEIDRASKIPEINRQFYVELAQISEQLQQLGDWGDDLSEVDRTTVAAIRAKIAEMGLSAIGVKESSGK